MGRRKKPIVSKAIFYHCLLGPTQCPQCDAFRLQSEVNAYREHYSMQVKAEILKQVCDRYPQGEIEVSVSMPLKEFKNIVVSWDGQYIPQRKRSGYTHYFKCTSFDRLELSLPGITKDLRNHTYQTSTGATKKSVVLCDIGSPFRACFSESSNAMKITFWHEPESVYNGTATEVWLPNRTGSKRRLPCQNCWKESYQVEDDELCRIGKRVKISWDDGDYLGQVVAYYEPSKKYKIKYNDGEEWWEPYEENQWNFL